MNARWMPIAVVACMALTACRANRPPAPDPIGRARARAEALLAAWNRGDAGGEYWDRHGRPQRLFGPLTHELVSSAQNLIEVRLRYRVRSVTKGGFPIEKLWDIVLVRDVGGAWKADRLEDPQTGPPPGPRRLASLEASLEECRSGAEASKFKGSTAATYLLICFQANRYTIDEAMAYLLPHSRLPVDGATLAQAAAELKEVSARP